MSIDISICICTYNRAEKLSRLLANIDNNLIISAKDRIEILIIDNNSTDESKNIIDSYTKKLPIRYLFEKQQGLSHARNCAINNAKGSWIIFTDDDVLLDAFWIQEYKKAIKTFLDADYMGGCIKPNWESGKPYWLKDDKLPLLSGVFGHYDLGDNNFRYETDDPVPYGGNFAVSKKLVSHIGEFNTQLGVKARDSGRGEETDYFQRAIDEGFYGFYIGSAVCLHEVDETRFSTAYMYKHGLKKGLAHAITHEGPFSNISLKHELIFIFKGMWQLIKGRRDRYYQCIINAGLLRGLRKAQVIIK